VRLLGPVRAESDGQPVDLGGPRARAILALLALTPGQVVAADDLLRDVWGDEQRPSARASLHAYLSRLRKALDPDRLATGRRVLTARPPGYELRPDLAEVDAARFARLAGEARVALEGGDHASAVRLFRRRAGAVGGTGARRSGWLPRAAPRGPATRRRPAGRRGGSG